MARIINLKKIGRKTLAVLMTLSLILGNVSPILAAGTTADPYDVGDVVYTADGNTKPSGVIPALTEWQYQGMTAVTYSCGKEAHQHILCNLLGRCPKEEHRHSDSCIKDAGKAEWKLVKVNNNALHLDIHIALTATYTLDGVPYTANVELTQEDYTSGRLKITATADFNITGTEIYDEGQRRFNGTFPVGTSENPVYYTITLTKDVAFNLGRGQTVTVPMTFEKTVQFWDSDNICETITQSSSNLNKWRNGEFVRGGMDFKMGPASDSAVTNATLTIQKNISGITLDSARTYEFGIYNSTGKVDTVEITIAAGGTTALRPVLLPKGESYYVVEEGAPAIDGYTLTTTAGGKAGTTTDRFTLTGDAAVVFENEYSLIPTYDYSVIAEYYLDGGKEAEVQLDSKTGVLAIPAQSEIEADFAPSNTSYGGNDYSYSGIGYANGVFTLRYDRVTPEYTLTVNWEDESGTALAPSASETLKQGAAYTTEEKFFAGYELKEIVGTAAGTITGDTEVTYIYSLIPTYDYSVIAEFYLDGSLEKTEDLAEVKGVLAIPTAAEIENLYRDDNNGYSYSGIGYENGIFTLRYDRVTPEYTLTVNWEDESGTALAPSVSETLKQGAAYSTEQKSFAGYSLKEIIGTASGTITGDTEVTYIYSLIPTYDYSVIAEFYLDGSLETEVQLTSETGVLAIPTAAEIENLYRDDNNGYSYSGIGYANGVFTLRYDRVTPEYTLTVNWEDESGAALAPAVRETLKQGAAYTTEQKSFAGYSLKEIIGTAAGTITGDTEVTYIYSLIPTYDYSVIAEFYLDGSLETEVQLTSETGVLAIPTAAEIENLYRDDNNGYSYSGIGYANGVFTLRYDRVTPEYTLTVNWEDESGTALAPSASETLKQGAAYTTEQKSFAGYELKEIIGTAAGTITGDTEVTYVYAEIQLPPPPPPPTEYTLTVNWIDENGTRLADTFTETKLENESYTAQEKAFDGYALKEITGDAASGTMNGDKSVTFVYAENKPAPQPEPQPEPQPVVIVYDYTVMAEYYLDGELEAGPIMLADVENTTTFPTAARLEKSYRNANQSYNGNLYSLAGISQKAMVFTLRFERETPPPVEYTLTVNWIDETGAQLADTFTEIKLENEAYAAQEKSFEGYILEAVTGDAASGIMDGDKAVTFVYSLIPAPVDIPEEDPPLVDIPEDEPPLADVPITGSSMSTAIAMAAASGLGLAGISRRRKEEE